MSSEHSLETRLRALGRLLDGRSQGKKDLCIVEAEGGFVVSMLEENLSHIGVTLVPRTVVIQPHEIQSVVREVLENSSRARGRRWFGLG